MTRYEVLQLLHVTAAIIWLGAGFAVALLVLGAEREGLPADVLATCAETATIPLGGGAESLNVATAGAIALYEARRG